jgi:hypothetical protein
MALSRAYHATERLVALGVARSSAVAIIRQVNTWLDSSGPEWTVRRLKDLKTAYTHHLNGDGWKPDWIAWRSGAPVGPFRFLWHHTTRKRAIRALNALMMYTSFVAPKATPTQIKKFMDSVLEPPGISPDLDLGLFSLPPMPVLKRKPWCGRLESSPPSPSRMMPVFGKSVPEMTLPPLAIWSGRRGVWDSLIDSLGSGVSLRTSSSHNHGALGLVNFPLLGRSPLSKNLVISSERSLILTD